MHHFNISLNSLNVPKYNALVGQASTQAGLSLSGQRSHFTTCFSCFSLVIAPKGQAMMHIQQPTHLSLSCCVSPVFTSLYIAPDIHAVTQAALSQCWHPVDIEMPSPTNSALRLLIGSGFSEIVLSNSLDLECSTAHAISQLPHPRHFFILQ